VRTSENGIELVKAFEGLHKVKSDGNVRSYRCPAGRWTIGYGHTHGVRSGETITPEEAEDLLRKDLQDCEAAVERLVKVDLTQNQFDALVSFVFNLGQGNFGSSTLLRKLNRGDCEGAAAEFVRWNKARVEGQLKALPGLTRRRTAEAALFEMDVELASEGGDLSAQKPQQVEAKSLGKSRTLFGLSVAGLSTGVNEATSQLQALTAYSDTLQVVFVVLTLIGIGIAVYARVDDHKESRR
jgi:lysozyme